MTPPVAHLENLRGRYRLVVAGLGLQGILGLRILQVLIMPAVFFYLTRPHVAAAFGRRSGPGPTPGVEVVE